LSGHGGDRKVLKLEQHRLLIVGLDHDKCSICGYIPTSFHVKYLSTLIEREQKKDKPSQKAIAELQEKIRKANKIISNHQFD